MKVRYGKPIKAKSLIGNQTSLLYNSQAESLSMLGAGNKVCLKCGSAYIRNIGAGVNVSLNSDHKYFVFMQIVGTLNNIAFNIYYANDDTQLSLDATQYKNLQDKIVCALLTNETKFRASHLYTWNNSFDDTSLISCYFLIDLTEIGLDNLTAEEFYNRYKGKLGLLATGEEITIDRKVGQLPISRLPLDYQEVEYIESTGTQYIKTDFATTKDTKVEIDLQGVSVGQSSSPIFGYRNGDDKYAIWIQQNTLKFAFNLGTQDTGYIFSQDIKTRCKLTMSKDGYYYNDIFLASCSNTRDISCLNSTVFVMNNLNDRIDNRTVCMKLFGLKISNNDLPVHNFIPCYRKSDNEIGLYDLVGKQFYVNQGTGTFLKGPNVNNTISCKVAGGSSDIYYGYNQLAINGDFANGKSSWNDWNSTTVVTNGVAEITRTNTSQSSLHQDISANPSDKIYVRATLWSDGTTPVKLGLNGGISWSGTATTSTTPVLFEVIKPVVSTGNGCRIELFGTGVANTKYYAKEINAINLTTWFGAGKEPSTVEEFKEKFTKEYYGFCSIPIKLTRYQIEALPTYGYNQLLNNPTFVLSCTTSQVSGKAVGTVDFVANNKYLIRCYQDKTMTSNTRNTFLVYLNGSPTYENTAENYNLNSGNRGWIYTPSESGTGNVQLWAHTPSVAVNYSDFQVINLTDWYGPGKEPTTVEEFKQTFPNKYYPYSQKRLLNKYMINKLVG